MLAPRKKAPSFDLPSDRGGRVSLKSLAGKYVVLYFYPRDLTPGCTLEAEAFRDAEKELARRNAVVVGVSRDPVASHQRFVQKCALNFPLLSDESGETIKAYGAWGEKVLYGKKSEGILRTTVLLDPAGKVVQVFPKVKVKGHAAEVLAALDQATAAPRS